jgi:hypothetical protein
MTGVSRHEVLTRIVVFLSEIGIKFRVEQAFMPAVKQINDTGFSR